VRRVGDRDAGTHVLGLVAQIELERGRARAGLLLSAEAVARSRGLGSVRGEAQSTVRFAEALIHQGEGRRAEEACRRALELVRGSGDRRGEAHALRTLGEALWCQERYEEAGAVLALALSAAGKVPDRYLEARAGTALGCVRALLGDEDGAAACFRAAGDHFAAVGAPYWRERTTLLLAALGRRERIASPGLVELVRP
ncbi:AfsR family transcriptional regulator, partial [Streptomyces griseus]|uniref:tetratricopeptide repeat protein n=1 Tax=Streptomyces griseus TaxID=1911 RepID=UPI001C57C0A6